MGLDRTESGTLLLRKPGLMRWSYDSPPGKVFVLDGHFAWFYTPGDAQVTRTPAKQLDDLRSPLRLLLGHTQLAKDLDQIATTPSGANFVITGVPKNMAQRVRLLTLTVTPTGEILGMKIEDTDGATTGFAFTGIEEDLPIPAAEFTFTPPPGLSVVDSGNPPSDVSRRAWLPGSVHRQSENRSLMPSISRLASIAACLLVLTFPFVASAQVSVYAAPALTDFVFFNNGNRADKGITGGLLAGAFYNFPHHGRLASGIDARVSGGFGAEGGTTILAANRLSFVPRHARLSHPPGRRRSRHLHGCDQSGRRRNHCKAERTARSLHQRHRRAGRRSRHSLNDSFDLRAFELHGAVPAADSNTAVGSASLGAGLVYHFRKHP